MAKARQPRRVITLQPPASHPNHPTLPSHDVLLDLQANLKAFDVANCVDVVPLASWEAYEHVVDLIGDELISLLLIDADGFAGRDFCTYRPLLTRDCIVVIDDYGGFGPPRYAKDKQDLVREWVGAAERGNELERLGVVPWGTYFGRIKP